MAGVDLVTRYVQDLIGKIQKVPAVRTKTVLLYSQEELLDYQRDVTPPCCAVIYAGMSTITVGNERRARAVQIVCEVVVLGGDVCGVGIQEIPRVTSVLDMIRDTIKSTVGEGEKVWKFISEYPLVIRAGETTAGVVGYSQRWVAVVADEA